VRNLQFHQANSQNKKDIKTGKFSNFTKPTAKERNVEQQKHQKWDYLAISGNTQQKSIRSKIH
jgi:hypothetical protein